MAYTIYNCNALTGGGSRALDSHSVSALLNEDRAICLVSGAASFFRYNSAGTAAENTTTHPYVVRPDDYSTAGNWEEQLAEGVSDVAFAVGWNGVANMAPSKNAVYDEIYQVVKAPASLTDHRLIRGAGGGRNVQASSVNVSDSGEMVNTGQPCFFAEPTSVQSNLTVNVNHTIAFGTEVFDVGNNFASNIFTAPVTGKYQLNCNINLQEINVNTDFISFKLVASNRTITYYYDTAGSPQYVGLGFSVVIDMDANDTAFLQIYVGSGSATTDIRTTSNFSGVLIC